jgi:hypothetical protein
MGDWPAAQRYYERRLAILEAADDPRVMDSLFDLACVAARQGRTDEALGFLRRAVDRGYADEAGLRDPDLDALRGAPEFQVLVGLVGTAAANRRNERD